VLHVDDGSITDIPAQHSISNTYIKTCFF
jgi:hypothetical protein